MSKGAQATNRGRVYVGVDPSYTCTGLAVWKDGQIHLQMEVRTPAKAGTSDGQRLRRLYEGLLALLRAEKPVLVAIEGYANDASYRPFAAGEVGGVFRLACAVADVPYVIVAPSQAKQFATGDGSASKERVRDAVVSITGTVPTSLDTSDAFALALIAEACDLGRSPREKRCEAQVIQTILHPKPKKPRSKKPFNM